jgi:hypothetical protein
MACSDAVVAAILQYSTKEEAMRGAELEETSHRGADTPT